jgi:hypothetical protein
VTSSNEQKKKRYAEDAEFRAGRLAYLREYRRKHKDEIAERRARRIESDPEYRETLRSRQRKSHLQRFLKYAYGLALADYNRMVAAQNGRCAICWKKPKTRLCVDHCHARRKVRRLLCRKCNSMLGFADDDPGRLERGAAYLREFREPAPATPRALAFWDCTPVARPVRSRRRKRRR